MSSTNSVSVYRIEDELSSLVDNAIEGRSRRKLIMREYGGFNLKKRRTLRSVADQLDISDECVRQYYLTGLEAVARYREQQKMEAVDLYLPACRAAVLMLEEVAPIHAQDAAQLLYEHGLTDNQNFSLEGFLSAVEDAGIETRIRCERMPRKLQSVLFVLPKEEDENKKNPVLSVVMRAHQKVNQSGAVHTDELVAELPKDGRNDTWRLRFVVRSLKCRPDFRWLKESQSAAGQTSGWLTLVDAGQNPIVSRLSKMFSVSDGIDEDTLEAGITHSYSASGRAPRIPGDIIGKIGVEYGMLDEAEYCPIYASWPDDRRVRDATVKRVYTKAGIELDPEAILPPMEYDVWKRIHAAGGMCRMVDIGDIATSDSELINLRAKLLTSPLVRKVKRGIYGCLPASPMFRSISQGTATA